MTEEYWKWPESSWTSKDIDWRKAKAVTAGLDIGAVSSQAVVMCDGDICGYASMRTGPDIPQSAEKVLAGALENTGMQVKNIQYTVGTGYGRNNIPLANRTLNEIKCHAQGARFMYGPTVKTVVDLGGQTSKAIKTYGWDRIRDFQVNDKCAINMGYGIEVMADLLQVPIGEIGEKSLSVSEEPEPVSTTCYVFANTEAIGLLRQGLEENEVLAAYLFAIAWRLYALIGRVDPEEGLAFTGGLAKNPGIVKRLEKALGITALTSELDPQLAGAIGAALFAQNLIGKTA